MRDFELFFNGHNCREFNLIVSKYPSIPRLNEEYDEVKIEGRNGPLYINKGTYENRKIDIEFKLISKTEEYYTDFEQVEEWLSNIEDNSLIYGRDDRKFTVKKVIIGDLKKELRVCGAFKVTFICDPFMRDIEETNIDIINNSEINNSGDFAIEPIIEITGSGDISIEINNSIEVTFKGIKNKVILNSELMLCLDADGNSILNKMYGDFPTFKQGKNTIVINGSITKATLKFRNLYR
nr:MAG TPA: distal tail protein [Caudoviricetes sp.]